MNLQDSTFGGGGKVGMCTNSFRLFLVLLSLLKISFCAIDCDNVLKDSTPFSGICSNKWSKLKPLVKRKHLSTSIKINL